MSKVLSIDNLHVAIDGKEILKGVNLTIRQGEVHALMGPNGSGKSTLSYALMGHPNYEVTAGTATLDGRDLLALEADERAKAGLFLAFQYPTSIPGVTVANFLRHAVTNVRNPDRKEGEDLISMRDFRKEIRAADGRAGHGPRVRPPLPERGLLRRREEAGRGAPARACSGPRSRSSTRPTAASTSTPSGSSPRGSTRSPPGTATGVLVITHYQRILNYIKPEFVHILFGGRIVESGGPELVDVLEREGYDWVRAKYPEAARDEDELEQQHAPAGQLTF